MGNVRTPGSNRIGEVLIEEESKLEERISEQYGKNAEHSFKEVPFYKIRIERLTAMDFINLNKIKE